MAAGPTDIGDAKNSERGNLTMATVQLYALWALVSIGAAGALLAWWVM